MLIMDRSIIVSVIIVEYMVCQYCIAVPQLDIRLYKSSTLLSTNNVFSMKLSEFSVPTAYS